MRTIFLVPLHGMRLVVLAALALTWPVQATTAAEHSLPGNDQIEHGQQGMAVANPVTRYTREDLAAAGYQSIADFLRALPQNSFGSLREESGNTAQGQATLALRGLGSARTLILLDGKRLPGAAALDAQSQNLNAIPFAMVDYIDVIPAGASARYGSQAIGGVVNIVLREGRTTSEVAVRLTEPDRPGGSERGFSLLDGFSRQGLQVDYGIEIDEQEIIYQRDRWYTRNRQTGPDPNEFTDYSDLSTYGRNVMDTSGMTYLVYPMISGVAPGVGTPNAAGAIGGSGDVGSGEPVCSLYGENFHPTVLADARFPGDYLCAYDYTQVAAQTASLDRIAARLNVSYVVDDDLEFDAGAILMRNTSRGQFAPTPSTITWNAPALPLQEINYNGNTYTLNPVDTGDELLFRWNFLPPRVTEQEEDQQRLYFGFTGQTGPFDWQARYLVDRNTLDETGTGYVSDLAVAQATRSGWDPRHPDQAQYANLLVDVPLEIGRRASNDVHTLDLQAAVTGPELSGGAVEFAFGGEYVDQDYSDKLARPGFGSISGSAGGDVQGRRSHWAVHGSALVPLLDPLDLEAALRVDDYNRTGSIVSSRFAAAYQLLDGLGFTASLSRDFRAPALNELYEQGSYTAASAIDFSTCSSGSVLSPATCLRDQFATIIAGNPELEFEKSNEFRAGFNWDVSPGGEQGLNLGADWYRVEIQDPISLISTQDAFNLELYGLLDEFPGVDVRRDTGGRHELTQTTYATGPDISVTGLDVDVSYGFSLGSAGEIVLDFQWSRILEYLQRDMALGPVVDLAGRPFVPDWRSRLNAEWMFGRHSIVLSSQFIAAQAGSMRYSSGFNALDPSTLHYVPADTDAIGDYENHDLIYSYQAPWKAIVRLGIRNLTDEDPRLSPDGRLETSLYPLLGKAWHVSYTQRF